MSETQDLEERLRYARREHERINERAYKVSGWLFAPIGMISFGGAALGSLAFGLFALVFAIPGFMALGVAIVVYWGMTRPSERRVELLEQELRQAQRRGR